jgi:hypothetical protein
MDDPCIKHWYIEACVMTEMHGGIQVHLMACWPSIKPQVDAMTFIIFPMHLIYIEFTAVCRDSTCDDLYCLESQYKHVQTRGDTRHRVNLSSKSPPRDRAVLR